MFPDEIGGNSVDLFLAGDDGSSQWTPAMSRVSDQNISGIQAKTLSTLMQGLGLFGKDGGISFAGQKEDRNGTLGQVGNGAHLLVQIRFLIVSLAKNLSKVGAACGTSGRGKAKVARTIPGHHTAHR